MKSIVKRYEGVLVVFSLFLLGSILAVVNEYKSDKTTSDFTECTSAEVSTELALQACSRAIDSGRLEFKQTAIAHYHRGLNLFALKLYEKALSDLDVATNMRADFVCAFAVRGISLERLDRPKLALLSYSRAFKVDPNFSKASKLHNCQGFLKQSIEQGVSKGSSAIY